MAARKGFPALYLSGGGTSALTGVPDIGIVDSKIFARKYKVYQGILACQFYPTL